MRKKILVAPNAFKGVMNSVEIAEVISRAIKDYYPEYKLDICPIADGGDGTLDVIRSKLKKAKVIMSSTYNPLMRRMKTQWLLIDSRTAFIEMAQASGISLLKDNEMNPMKTSSYGTGILMKQALDKGCKQIIVSLGGSATVDCGMGILSALGGEFYDRYGDLLPPIGSSLINVKRVDLSNLDARLSKIELIVLCDVKSKLLGVNGAIKFAKQKGADSRKQKKLYEGLKNYSKVVGLYVGKSLHTKYMTGAAGGIAFSLYAIVGARLELGFDFISALLKLDERIQNVDVVITGEGKFDSQTLLGKGTYELIKLASKREKSIYVICGDCEKNINCKVKNVKRILILKENSLTKSESLRKTPMLIRKRIKDIKTF